MLRFSQICKHERHYGLGMDAVVAVCSCNTNGIVVWAWMLWSPYAVGTRTELWFWHGCSGCHAFNTRSAQGILRLQLQGPSSFYVLTIRLPRLCTAVWPRRGFDWRRSRSLQESAPALKVLQAKLGHGQIHCTDADRATA